ncbi:MAG: M3 family metallopeptidase [Deltaproteobacteria bacterium]|nr:M3 family metallopeptidase [Deltaproteobacteria bacterium]
MTILFALPSTACGPAGTGGGSVEPAGPGTPEVPVVEPNPLLEPWPGPFGGVPPFAALTDELYEPGLVEAMCRHRAEVDAIKADPEPPTFENTLVALERSGFVLDRVRSLFSLMNATRANDLLQDVQRRITPELTRHYDALLLDEALYARIRSVFDRRDELGLTGEPRALVERYHLDFVRAGAALPAEGKQRLADLNSEISALSVQFSQNLLAETDGFLLLLETEDDLAGLPERVRAEAADTAARRGHEGQWAVTLQNPSWIPFLTFSTRRDLREQVYTAYTHRGDNGNAADNKALVAKIAALRAERAALLGYPHHAAYVLEDNMALTVERVRELLDRLWEPALRNARREADDMRALIGEDGDEFELRAWDWWYYAERIRKARYDLDEDALRPYFPLERVRDGAFEVARKLYGITFHPREDLPGWHPDVRAFEVREADGRVVGVFYTDYHTREGKRSGAFSTALREQSRVDGESLPVIANVCNFPAASPDRPALLSLDDVHTLFHEFGHALHGLLSDRTYPRLTGTSVVRDFVELPSQIMENWAEHPDVLREFARHVETGEPIPDELVDRIQQARTFNEGFATTEYLAASYLDLAWHERTETAEADVTEFERAELERLGLIPEIVSRYRSTYFAHVFSGGYSSGYYSYIWAAVLDADAFEAFREAGLYDPETARKFRENILAAGGTEPPMDLYLRFRGREPAIEPLLVRRGLL